MEWEQRFCPNQHCTTEGWLVRPSQHVADLWSVASRFEEMTYTVAATDPVCPSCGTTLCAALDLGQRRDERIIESGAMLDFVRSLR